MQNSQMTGAGYGSFDGHPPLDAQVIGVSVDFGMTGSSVSFYHNILRPIEWKLRPSGTQAGSKIPTTISYDQDGIIAEWAFSPGTYDTRAHCLFKSLFDPDIWDQKRSIGEEKPGGFNSLEAVRNCVKDYLTVLLETAFREISEKIGSTRLVVNLISTHPTTWKAATVEDYRKLTRKAFKKATQRCSPIISIWHNTTRLEAESYTAGVYIFDENYRFIGEETSCFFILDVGGATTDPAFLQAFHDPSRPPTLKSVTKLQVPGFKMGCTDIDNRFSDLVIKRLHSRLEQDVAAPGVEKSSSLLLTTANNAYNFGLQREWVQLRNKYTKNMPFPADGQTIRIVWSDDGEGGDHRPQEENIIIKRTDMEDIFNASLVTAIQELIRKGQQTLSSIKLGEEDPQKISYLLLCGGGGLMPRIYECVRDTVVCKTIRTTRLDAPSMGALLLVRNEVEHLHTTLKVGTKKNTENDSSFVKLTGQEVDNHPLPNTLAFSHKWKQQQGRTVLGQFVLEIDDYLPGPTRKEKWTLRSPAAETGSQSRLQIFQKTVKYRICLTLPTTTSEVTPLDFSAFLVNKDGRETRVKCMAEKEI